MNSKNYHADMRLIIIAISIFNSVAGFAAEGVQSMSITLKSPSFTHQGEIPGQFTCDGSDISPAFTWSGVPQNTKSLVFIVDDEQAISKLLSFWVKDKWGYDVEVFSNGEAMLKGMSAKPDLVLLDLRLPEMDGLQVLAKVKEKYPEIEVIMVSL